jgi:hypothetical protein
MTLEGSTTVHSALQTVIAKLRGVAAASPTHAETRAGIAAALEVVSVVSERMAEHREVVDACAVVWAEIRQRGAALEGRTPAPDGLIDALSSTESELVQLREIAARSVGGVSLQGTSEVARAIRYRAVMARLLRLAQYGAHDETALQRARLVGAGITNLLGSDAEQVLSIRARSTLVNLRRSLHEVLLTAVTSPRVSDDHVVGLLSDVVAVLELLLGQTNAMLRDHDRAILEQAKTYFEEGNPQSAMLGLESLRGLNEDLDRTLLGQQPAEVAMSVNAVLAELEDRRSLSGVYDFSLDTIPPPRG